MNNPQTIKEAIMLYTQAWNEKEPANIKAKIERCWPMTQPMLMHKTRW